MLTEKEMERNAGQALVVCQYSMIEVSPLHHAVIGRPGNNGVSRYPSYQKIFQLAENFQNIYRTLSKLDKFSLNFLSTLQIFL